MKIQQINIDEITPDPNQPRKVKDIGRIKDMAQSMKKQGVINPIEIDENYIIVTGEMRWLSAKEAGLKTVPCKVMDISTEERYERQVVENVHHNTMGVWDTAVAITNLLPTGCQVTTQDKGVRDLSRKIGKSHSWIIEQRDIINAPKEIAKAIKEEKVKSTMVRVLKSTPDEHREVMTKKIVDGDFGTRDGGVAVAKRLKERPDMAKEILKEDYSDKRTIDTHEKLAEIAPTSNDEYKKDDDYFKQVEDLSYKLHNLLRKNPFGKQNIKSFIPRNKLMIYLDSLTEDIEIFTKGLDSVMFIDGDIVDGECESSAI